MFYNIQELNINAFHLSITTTKKENIKLQFIVCLLLLTLKLKANIELLDKIRRRSKRRIQF